MLGEFRPANYIIRLMSLEVLEGARWAIMDRRGLSSTPPTGLGRFCRRGSPTSNTLSVDYPLLLNTARAAPCKCLMPVLCRQIRKQQG